MEYKPVMRPSRNERHDPIPCSFCDKEIQNRQALEVHIRYKHLKTSQRVASSIPSNQPSNLPSKKRCLKCEFKNDPKNNFCIKCRAAL